MPPTQPIDAQPGDDGFKPGPPRMPTHQHRSRAALALAAVIGSAIPTGALAQGFVPYPSQDSLRQVQLAALACARENTAASCEQARKLADPLLDHPRLPAACKDQLWNVSQKSRPAAENSFARRDGIEQPAQLVMLACRSNEKPLQPATPAPAPSGGGGLKFGGGR